jgi:hypothetical protein
VVGRLAFAGDGRERLPSLARALLTYNDGRAMAARWPRDGRAMAARRFPWRARRQERCFGTTPLAIARDRRGSPDSDTGREGARRGSGQLRIAGDGKLAADFLECGRADEA